VFIFVAGRLGIFYGNKTTVPLTNFNVSMHNVPDTTGSILFNIPTYKIFTLYNELFELLLFVFLLFLSILWLINVIIFEVRIYKILLIDQEISSTY